MTVVAHPNPYNPEYEVIQTIPISPMMGTYKAISQAAVAYSTEDYAEDNPFEVILIPSRADGCYIIAQSFSDPRSSTWRITVKDPESKVSLKSV